MKVLIDDRRAAFADWQNSPQSRTKGDTFSKKKAAAQSVVMVKVWVLLVTCLVASATSFKHAWQNPGCHKVGHTRRISIPECLEFDITTNACRGFCESWSVPSAWQTLASNPHQVVTSIGQCCNIMDTEDLTNSLTIEY
ncbi:thyrostimulin alpha-2 subunit-like [Homarus americanus]|uniref:thyrostimulin alpha-2 subunit-like n=1 Tax=Homarus americanus TaxID=6706 RepID=UPI001C45EA1D|nr:thyrostimulin alpha-2 subunit-like [Homarus americanus]